MMVTVQTTEELLAALLDNEEHEVLVRSGRYDLPADDLFTVAGATRKRVIGVPDAGPVQLVGRMTWRDCFEIWLDNLCLRAPIQDRILRNLTSYDCLTAVGCEQLRITRCSILGGADETVSIIDSSNCSIKNSLIGCCFETDRNHDMAMLVSCDGFELVGNVITAADRRKPQVQEFGGSSPLLIADNRIDCGTTMTVGLKPQSAGLSIDIVNNVFARHASTKTYTEEIEAVNGSIGLALVFAENNTLLDGTPAGIDLLTNGEHIRQVTLPHLPETRALRRVCYPGHVGPTVRDAWHNYVLSQFGSGKTWKTENDPGFPAL
jgi:hypothetical protein